jgi:nucleoid-associated protein YgaU
MSNLASSTAMGAAAGGPGAAAAVASSFVPAYIQAVDYALPTINFQFNPESISETTKGNWNYNNQPATNGSTPQWKGTEPGTVSVVIFLDMFSPPKPTLGITETIEALKAMVLPTPDSLEAGVPAAPIVCFGWGPNIVMPMAIIERVVAKYERFMMGEPVRATVTVDLKAVPLPSTLGPTNPSSGGLAKRRTHTVVEGDTLASIAYSAYKDPNRWRAIAVVNGIDDPMRLRVGQILDVPDRNTARALA